MASTIDTTDPSPAPPARRRPALPHLDGWRFTLFRPVWLTGLAAALLSVAIGGWLTYRNNILFERPMSELGLRGGWGNAALGRPISEEARLAGIVPGSVLVAIDGRPIPLTFSNRDDISEAMRGQDGARVRLSVRLPSGAVRDVTLTRSSERLSADSARIGISPGAAATIRLVATGVASILMLGAAILLFRRRGREPVAALLSLSMLAITAGDSWAYMFYGHFGLTWIGDIFNAVGYPLLPVVLMAFPDGRFVPGWTRWLALLDLVWAIVVYFGLSFRELNNVILVALLVAGVAFIALRYRRLPAGAQRLQIKWATLGFAGGTAFFIVYNILDILRQGATDEATLVWANIAAPVAISAYLLCFAAGLLVSILRYRLYDADAAVSRSAAYALLTLLLGAAFAASAKAMEIFVESTFGGEAGALPGVIGAGLAVVLITPLNNRLQGWAERRFQKALLHLRRDLPELLRDLRSEAPLDEILDTVVDRVVSGVRAVRVAALVEGEIKAVRGLGTAEVERWAAEASFAASTPVDCVREDALFPIRVPLRARAEGDPLGWLLVGPRPDGSVQGKDEREALAEIAGPVALAIGAARRREARETAQEARLAALEAKLSEALAGRS